MALCRGFGFYKGSVLRVASYNLSLNRNVAGELIVNLTAGDFQASLVAEVIQRANPDVILLNEFDYDEDGVALGIFQAQYLEVSQNGAAPVTYEYSFLAPSNTGIPSGFDLDNNNRSTDPGDAYGFGFFPGQFAMAILSKYPIDMVRTFQFFLWKDMVDGMSGFLDPATNESWYSPEELNVLRLSSKSHWDVPIKFNGHLVHILASHPTPPVFDGPEDRNGIRNHDEIKFWLDYVSSEADYIYDDAGTFGGLSGGKNSYYVVCGDQNADCFDGDSFANAACQLTESPLFNNDVVPASDGGVYAAESQGGLNRNHSGNPAYDTADFGFNGLGNPDTSPGNLRTDYALPSASLDIQDAGVFWLTPDDPFWPLGQFPASDHRLVWVDLTLPVSD